MDMQTNDVQQSSGSGNRRLPLLIAGAGCAVALCFGLVLAGIGLFTLYRTSSMPGGLEPAVNLQVTPAEAREHFRPDGRSVGNPNAPVKIEIYSDFQCPYCKRFWADTESQLFEEYVSTGKVYFTYRSLGAFIGQESQRAAEAAYCASDQEKFWEYHDLLFTNQGAENAGVFSDAHLTEFAQSLKLDMTAFNKCFQNGKYTEQVNQDAADAQAANINSTPTFLINGTMLQGAQPYEVFKQAIDNELKK
jgi:protein-disulfide isomerase